MREIVTHVEIEAPAELVWEVLTNFEAYPEWNSLFWPKRGMLKPGSPFRFRLRLGRALGLHLQARIHKAEPGRELCWQGRIPPRLLTGEHYLTLEPLGKERVRFVQREIYTGALVWIYTLVLGSWVRRAYDRMNRELKLRSEALLAQSRVSVPAT